MLTQIGMQAAVGAGIDGASQVAASAGMVSQQTAVRKLNLEEILLALDSLGGVCSQVHLGWWSYEWCHREEVKQFHVGVSQRGAQNSPQLVYEVQNVIHVGHFNGHIEIIYPAGNYASAEDSQGTTITLLRDSDGKIIDTDVRVHSNDESLQWKRSHTDNEVIRRYHKNKSFESRGPIIKHTFDHGELCDEVGHPRQISVEIRCCTEDEMLHWTKSKATSANKLSLAKKDVPKAALISVEVDDGTKLDNANVLNYGQGRGEIAGVNKKEGTTGPFCFKYTRAKSDVGSTYDEITHERMPHDVNGGDNKSAALHFLLLLFGWEHFLLLVLVVCGQDLVQMKNQLRSQHEDAPLC
jgi:hypothetical protein